MSLTPAEEQEVEAALDAFIDSPNVQSTLTNVNANLEKNGLAFADKIIAGAKVGGLLGTLFNALKGSAEAELNSLAASLPPAALTALETNAIKSELKSLLG